MKEANRLRIIEQVITKLDIEGNVILQLKEAFRENRNWGSRDRKLVTEAVLAWLRCGNAVPIHLVKYRIFAGMWLADVPENPFFGYLCQEFNPDLSITEFDDKLAWLHANGGFDVNLIYPHSDLISQNRHMAARILFQRQDFWIRVPQGLVPDIQSYFQARNISFQNHPNLKGCIKLPSGTRLDEIRPDIRAHIQVQDAATQQLGPVFEKLSGGTIWDACAASGGKSLLFSSFQASSNLYVSDIRPQILSNLSMRFTEAGIESYGAAVIDLEKPPVSPLSFQFYQKGKPVKQVSISQFDGIILDVPCSGSGTWRHQPERLLVENQEPENYVIRQRNLFENVYPFLKPGGFLIYITCSIWSNENENQIPFLENFPDLSLIKTAYLNEWENGGDSLFYILIQKNLSE